MKGGGRMAPIRVLHCVAGLGHGGYESLIMNLYRNIDREKVQFDFVSSFPGVYEPENTASSTVNTPLPIDSVCTSPSLSLQPTKYVPSFSISPA